MTLKASIGKQMSLVVVLTSAFHGAAAGASCRPLQDTVHGWSVDVDRPGSYCLIADLSQSVPPAWLQLPHQPGPMSSMMSITAGDVTVDLGGHSMKATRPAAPGIWLNRGAGNLIHSVQILNGSIRTDKRAAVFMAYAFNRRNKRFGNQSIADDIAVADSLSDYRHTGFVLENLTIESGVAALILQGRDNVVRHCKIIGGNGTVNLYGPGLIFEDNEIILNASETKPGGEAPVALYLEDAADSIVRNNRITVRGHEADAEAIVLRNSPNVVLQNNTVAGARQDYRLLDQQSSVRAQSIQN